MISPAVRWPNSTERSISSAVSASSVPWSAERAISEASSVDERADRSSSWGSMPSERTIAFAEPFSNRIGQVLSVVNARMKPWVARAVSIGLAMARFFGTSSPKIMVNVEPMARPSPTASGCTTPSGTPQPSRGGEIRSEIAGSARKPMARLVTVMPTWAPESCVERLRSAASTPFAPVSPSAAACSTRDRSTVTNANSAATNTPQRTISTSETASRIHAVIGGPREGDGADEEGRPCAASASFGCGEVRSTL